MLQFEFLANPETYKKHNDFLKSRIDHSIILNETKQTDISIESSISIKPVFESFMKDDTFFENVCEYNISQFSTFYQWKLLKFFEKNDGKRFKKIIESDTWYMNPLNFYSCAGPCSFRFQPNLTVFGICSLPSLPLPRIAM